MPIGPMTQPSDNGDALPLVAGCRRIGWRAPFEWLRCGWADMRNAPLASLSFGVVTVLISYAITAATWAFGNLGLYLGLVSGFVFLGPLLGLALYAISARLEDGLPTSVQAAARVLGDAIVFALVLLVVFLVWASMVYVFFPVSGQTTTADWLLFLGIGSSVGALFCAIIFMVSAFSLPMLLDRRTDTITALLTSVNATLRNKLPMSIWAVCIGICMAVGLLTLYLGFVVLLPLIGHATWHGYRETIDASPWPRQHESA